MADIIVTAANVGLGSDQTVYVQKQAGEAITQGQSLFMRSGKAYLADASVSTENVVAGVAMSAASTDGYFIMATEGLVNLGATLVVGTIYVLSDTPGGIGPIADAGSGDYISIIGVATTTSLCDLQINNSGVAIA